MNFYVLQYYAPFLCLYQFCWVCCCGGRSASWTATAPVSATLPPSASSSPGQSSSSSSPNTLASQGHNRIYNLILCNQKKVIQAKGWEEVVNCGNAQFLFIMVLSGSGITCTSRCSTKCCRPSSCSWSGTPSSS